MGYALGFGSNEQAFEQAEQQEISEHIEARFRELELEYFSDEFIVEIREWIDERAKQYKADDRKYKTAAEYPDRYSYYWPHILADASFIVVILSIHHINRRHAMSPDGWALFQNRVLFEVRSLDIEPAPKEQSS